MSVNRTKTKKVANLAQNIVALSTVAPIVMISTGAIYTNTPPLSAQLQTFKEDLEKTGHALDGLVQHDSFESLGEHHHDLFATHQNLSRTSFVSKQLTLMKKELQKIQMQLELLQDPGEQSFTEDWYYRAEWNSRLLRYRVRFLRAWYVLSSFLCSHI